MLRSLRFRLGARKPCSEIMFFDSRYYLSEYKDVAASGLDPFLHFMENGWKEGRNPSADFNTLYYRDRHLDGRPVNPLSHYVREGIKAGLRTKPRDEQDFIDVQMPVVLPFFDPTGYFAQVEGDGTEPLLHYLRRGWRENVAIRTEVDLDSYAAHLDHVKRLGVSPLYHHASQKRLLQGLDLDAQERKSMSYSPSSRGARWTSAGSSERRSRKVSIGLST